MMRKATFCLVLILSCLVANAQLPTRDNIWDKYSKDYAIKLGLSDLNNSDSKFYLRLWYYGDVESYVLNLNLNKDSTLKGSITIFTNEVVDIAKENPTGRIFSLTTKLDSLSTSKIRESLLTENILRMSSDNDIKGWNQEVLDGDMYVVESQEQSTFSHKTYNTPSIQGDLKEAKLLLKFVNDILTIIDYKTLRFNFDKKIPFESYNTGGSTTASKILTKRQAKDYKKDRDNYRKAHGVSNKKPEKY